MNGLNNAIKDLLGKSARVEFHIPFDDNLQLQYDSTFGVQSDLSIRKNLKIVAPSSGLKLKSAFGGQLYYKPGSSSLNVGDVLILVIGPSQHLINRVILSGEMPTPREIIYADVDKTSVSSAIKQILIKSGSSASEIKKVIDKFIEGNGYGVFVNSGESLGNSAKATLKIQVRDSSGQVLNPHYLIWRYYHEWKKKNVLIDFKSKNHSLISKLQFNQILSIKGGQVQTQGGKSLGPTDFVLP